MLSKSFSSIIAAAVIGFSTFAAPQPAMAEGFFKRTLSITVTPTGKQAEALRRALAARSKIGSKNRASIEQNGVNNAAGISQSGSGNYVGIFQKGNNNTAMATQNGNNNSLAIVQLGNGKKSNVTQTGNGKSQIVFQSSW